MQSIDPNMILEALKLTLSGDNEQISRGDSAILSISFRPGFVKNLLIISTNSNVSFFDNFPG